MMEPRNQFTFYRSYWEAIKRLPKKDRLSVLDALIEYALYGTEPEVITPAAETAFILVKPTLDSGRRKSETGKQGGSKEKAKRKQNESKAEANAKQIEREKEIEEEKEVENECYIASADADSSAEAENAPPEKGKIPYAEIVAYLNEKAGTEYRASTQKTRTCIHARWEEGFRLEDFKTVISKKCAAWKGTDMEKYLRPETLFGTKFEGYLNERGPDGEQASDTPDGFKLVTDEKGWKKWVPID